MPRDPLVVYREPHRTRIREAAHALAQAFADAHSGYGLLQLGLSVDDLERSILALSVPLLRVVPPDAHDPPR